MRFVRSGRNWEGREWVVNDAIHFLAAQIEEAWPERHPSDGTVASQSHDAASPNSDHRPYPYNGSGIVYALDMGEVTEDDGILLAEELRRSRDSRIRYVIHEDRIFSSYSNAVRGSWQWGAYTKPGLNPHTNHVHISVYRTAGPGDFAINLGDDMADHVHKPMPAELPRSWGDEPWDDWVSRSGTNDDTREHTFYREDLGWVYQRIIKPLEQEVSRLAAEVEQLKNQAPTGNHNHDGRYVRIGQEYRIG